VTKDKTRADMVQAVAARFVERLKASMSALEFLEVQARNEEEQDPNVCHSHDYVDANEGMAEAIADITGEWPDIRNEALRSLWNDAWNHARATGAL
jgi:hypothetical protein